MKGAAGGPGATGVLPTACTCQQHTQPISSSASTSQVLSLTAIQRLVETVATTGNAQLRSGGQRVCIASYRANEQVRIASSLPVALHGQPPVPLQQQLEQPLGPCQWRRFLRLWSSTQGESSRVRAPPSCCAQAPAPPPELTVLDLGSAIAHATEGDDSGDSSGGGLTSAPLPRAATTRQAAHCDATKRVQAALHISTTTAPIPRLPRRRRRRSSEADAQQQLYNRQPYQQHRAPPRPSPLHRTRLSPPPLSSAKLLLYSLPPPDSFPCGPLPLP